MRSVRRVHTDWTHHTDILTNCLMIVPRKQKNVCRVQLTATMISANCIEIDPKAFNTPFAPRVVDGYALDAHRARPVPEASATVEYSIQCQDVRSPKVEWRKLI